MGEVLECHANWTIQRLLDLLLALVSNRIALDGHLVGALTQTFYQSILAYFHGGLELEMARDL